MCAKNRKQQMAGLINHIANFFKDKGKKYTLQKAEVKVGGGAQR